MAFMASVDHVLIDYIPLDCDQGARSMRSIVGRSHVLTNRDFHYWKQVLIIVFLASICALDALETKFICILMSLSHSIYLASFHSIIDVIASI